MKPTNEEEEEAYEWGGPLTLSETRRLRRMLQDDMYARRFKTTLKVWVITIGTIASIAAAAATIWRELAFRLIK